MMRASDTLVRDNFFMRSVDSQVRQRQERALFLALSGVPLHVIASTLQYAGSSGAWKAIRSAAARKANLDPKIVQHQLAEREEHYRSECQSRALQDLLADKP
jgi:hypothetical protein